MPFSIWDYLRQRTKDAVLAGIQDAMDTVEQGDSNGSQHAAANQLTARLGTPEVNQLPSASINGQAESVDGDGAAQASTKAPQKPAEPSSFDDDLERRIDAAASQNGPESGPASGPETPRITTRPRRGRPPKNSR